MARTAASGGQAGRHAERAIDPSSVGFADTFSRKGRRVGRAGGQDLVQDGFREALDGLVGEAQHLETLGPQPGVSCGVSLEARLMVRAVGLDDQAMAQADEVDDVAADPQLAAKLEAVEPAVAEELPQQTLGHGRVPAQGASEGELSSMVNHKWNNT